MLSYVELMMNVVNELACIGAEVLYDACATITYFLLVSDIAIALSTILK